MRRTMMTLLLAAGLALPLAAQARLSAPGARITDDVIAHDYATFDAWRERLDTLPVSDSALAIYARAKARAWLDFAEEEYTDDDRSALPQQALSEAERLIVALERGAPIVPAGGPLVEGLTRQRSSAYAALDADGARWRVDGTLERMPAHLAVFEVELLRGERRENSSLACRPEPHRRESARLARLLRQQPAPVVQSPPAPDAADAAAPAATQPDATPEPAAAALPTRVHFAFDRAFLGKATRGVLDRVVLGLRADPTLRVALEGHTDTRGPESYNVGLGQRRVRAVEAYLVAAGVGRSRITGIATLGESRPGPEVRADLLSTARNRRVTLSFTDARGDAVPGTPQDDDLQPERRRN